MTEHLRRLRARPDDLLERLRQRPIPVIWLLGKTGAGKSSLVQQLTGLERVEVGNGFESCTRTSAMFDFPAEEPVLRFLDTRGLGEVGYDPGEDIRVCEGHSHVILALMRLDDPVQGGLAEALADVLKRKPGTRVIAVHTAADLVPDEDERQRAMAANQAVIDRAAGAKLPSVSLSLAKGREGDAGYQRLLDLLGETMPEVALSLAAEDRRDAEARAFHRVRPLVAWYAAAAGSSDILPLVGAVAVPTLQAVMLQGLAARYETQWTTSRFIGFGAALGTGAALRYGANYALRQAAKLVPVVGQTIGSAAAGTVSLATTFALGRAAGYYLFMTRAHQSVDADELRARYRAALKGAGGK